MDCAAMLGYPVVTSQQVLAGPLCVYQVLHKHTVTVFCTQAVWQRSHDRACKLLQQCVDSPRDACLPACACGVGVRWAALAGELVCQAIARLAQAVCDRGSCNWGICGEADPIVGAALAGGILASKGEGPLRHAQAHIGL